MKRIITTLATVIAACFCATAQQQNIYMPSDKAKVLMADNAEVNELVKALKLEIK